MYMKIIEYFWLLCLKLRIIIRKRYGHKEAVYNVSTANIRSLAMGVYQILFLTSGSYLLCVLFRYFEIC